METNVRILITFLMIALIILSFSLGYFVARNHAETRFFNLQSKLAKAKLEIFKDKMFDNNVKVKKIEKSELPPDFLKFLEELEKEEEENNNGK